MAWAAFQSLWGKAYKYWPIKLVYLLSIILFEVGSVICGAAPSSTALIIGRAIAGIGGAGISSGSYLIVAISAPPSKVPALQGIIGASFAVASMAGPLVGEWGVSEATERYMLTSGLAVLSRLTFRGVGAFTEASTRPIDTATCADHPTSQPPHRRRLLCDPHLFLPYTFSCQPSTRHPQGKAKANGQRRHSNNPWRGDLLPPRHAMGGRHQAVVLFTRHQYARRRGCDLRRLCCVGVLPR